MTFPDAIRAAALSDNFDGWFCYAKSVEAARNSGWWDFSHHILTPEVTRRISDPHRATCLEIGYGGGRLMAPAKCHFGRAVGVDIHDQEARVNGYLSSYPGSSQLVRYDGTPLPLKAKSVSLVYSFIVFQHFSAFSEAEWYMREIARVMSGVAQIYYKPHKHPGKVMEYAAPPNHATLEIGRDIMVQLAESCGLRVVDEGESSQVMNRLAKGGQRYITLEQANA